ncbi:MAG TPA: large conductance mechanosensitive channel protein MscL [Flavobacteriales bacterium]|nr:large-conductance mechanosensitive channel protein MscL [Flavobacteriales bacterium]HAW19037.1 large conductance mechanosensitive channel protein MscL [Flavobacteriales bacterium]
MLKEFKTFISKGNVMEMAVGLIMATYFGAIIKSLVADIIMPPIGMLMGGVDFADLQMVLQEGIAESSEGAGDAVAQVAISYGVFINTIITFVIVAFAIFMVVKGYNKMKANMEKKKAEEAPAAPPAPTKEEVLLGEIRDLLKK